MKHVKKYILVFVSILLISGCGNKTGKNKIVNSTNPVDEIINNQSEEITESTASTETTVSTGEAGQITEEETAAEVQTVDYDLTKMSSDMVYVMVYQMMTAPDRYVGKTFRIDGNFYATYYEPTEKYYYYCIIQDATACCAQGMEFVWDDGSHIYPDEYPEDNANVVVEGTFETYTEEGDDSLYCRLSNATLE